jgi:hypothetical protein
VDRSRIARRLGGPNARRRRHRRVALLVVGLLVLGGVLMLIGDGDGAREPTAPDVPTALVDVAAACRASNEEIGTAQRALLGDNDAPDAIEGFLGDAFVDLTRDRAAAIRAVGPPPDVVALVDEHDRVVDAVEADPAAAVETNPFDDLNQRWRDLRLGDCAIDSSTVPQE